MMIIEYFSVVEACGWRAIVGYYDPNALFADNKPITWSVMLVPRFTWGDEIDWP